MSRSFPEIRAATVVPWLSACVLLATTAIPGTAQSATLAAVTGTVRGADDRAVSPALVVATPIGPGSRYEASTGPSGAFNLGLIQPGSYELRVEALGYRPLVARVLTVGGGEQRSVQLILTPAAPPITQVDTLALAAGTATRIRPGGIQISGWGLNQLPSRFDDLATLASFSTEYDESLGAQGLPGDLTMVIADGVPFYRAPHPVARQAFLPDALFPTSALSSVAPQHVAHDAEWRGAPGGYVTVATRAPDSGGGLELEGAYSGNPTWSSSELDIETPSLFDFKLGAQGTVAVQPGRSQLTLSGEAFQQQTPLAPRDADDTLGGLDPDVLTALSEPGVETYRRYSGLARYDARQGTSNQFFVRAAGAFSQREFEGLGPVTLAGASAPADESIDLALAAGVVTRYSATTQVEVRAGFSGSYRDFGAGIDELPPGFLVGSGTALGDAPSAWGSSDRRDFTVLPILRYSIDSNSTAKLGISARFSNHTMVHSDAERGEFLFSDPSGLLVGQGFGRVTRAPEATFKTREYGAFVQYEATVTRGLDVTVGARYDYELLAGDPPDTNAEWLQLSGIRNSDFPDAFHQFSARGSLNWDLSGRGTTRLMGAAALDYGDMDSRDLYQLVSQATEASTTRYAGSSVFWPEGGLPVFTPELPTVTLMSPDARPPRSTHLSAGLWQRVGSTTAVFLRGSFRRTDFLTRRRNLNQQNVPRAADPQGRPIFGSFTKDGSVVVTTALNARRFPSFGDAWALDPDGWSEYRGLTVGVEHSGDLVEILGSYTYSETTDNWIAAASGSIGATLPPQLTQSGAGDWSEGTSDFDATHRAAGGASFRVGPATIVGVYRFRSGLPFTPRYRLGVDANGDGSDRNDVAFIPAGDDIAELAAEWSCLGGVAGGFATRNSCRGSARHTVDARFEFVVGSFGGRQARIMIDALNLVEDGGGVIDDALLLVDPDRSISSAPGGLIVTIPTIVNPNFGQVLYPASRGRLLRIGVRVGG